MPRKSVLPKSRRHIMVFDEDWEWLIARYNAPGPTKLGAGEACCEIIHQRIKAMREFETALHDELRS